MEKAFSNPNSYAPGSRKKNEKITNEFEKLNFVYKEHEQVF
jgi:hypothetical protein